MLIVFDLSIHNIRLPLIILTVFILDLLSPFSYLQCLQHIVLALHFSPKILKMGFSMPQTGFKRKLTAKLSAVVEGYSSLMRNDEANTIQTLKEYKKAMTSHINQNLGRVVDAPGDNLIA
jgi:hypothetical protein